jgi:hypothetical protein
MKRWFCFLLVCWGVVFLLLNPGHQAGVNHELHASCDGSVNCWRELVPTSIRTLPATSIEFVRSRAGPLKSLVACCALLTPADGIGPPGLDQRWQPSAFGRSGQASSSEERAYFLHEIPSVQWAAPGRGVFQHVSKLDAIGEVDGVRCLIDWKTTTSRYPEAPEGLFSLDPELC